MPIPHLEMENVTVSFPSSVGIVTALKDISIKIPAGQWLTVVGGNGSGKTTLLNVISGTVKVESGSVILDGKSLNGVPAYRRCRRIGRVFQNPLDGTAPTLSVFENLCLAARRSRAPTVRGLLKRALRDEFRRILAEFKIGLEARLDDPVAVLSGGLRQCLSVAMASLGGVELLLLDEHLAALDAKTAQLALVGTAELITKMRLTTIMVVHDLGIATGYGDRVLALKRGGIVLDVMNDLRILKQEEIRNVL